MWRWAGSSEPGPDPRPRSRRAGPGKSRGPRGAPGIGTSLLVLIPALVAAAPVEAQTGLTQREALRLAFPEPAEIERHTAFLSDADLARAREMAGDRVTVEQSVVTYYTGRRNGEPLGVAYFDAHRVRTLPEVLMIVVTPGAEVERIEVLKFAEPPDYLPPEKWLEQFRGLELSPKLSRKGRIVNITGATLTSRAVTRATRRVLALHRVVDPLGEEGAGDPGGAEPDGGGVEADDGGGGQEGAGHRGAAGDAREDGDGGGAAGGGHPSVGRERSGGVGPAGGRP